MPSGHIRLFALDSSRAFGQRMAETLGIEVSRHEEREFEDGEHKARPRESVRGADAYVVQSLHGDDDRSVNDKLVRLLLFLAAVRDAGAARVTAVVPYLCYARKDRRTKTRDPVSSRYVAALFEATGIDRVVTLEAHNVAAFQNAFRIPTEHLEAKRLFVDHFVPRVGDGPVCVLSPDVGGVKRAERTRELLEATLGRGVSSGFMEKKRSEGVVTGERLFGDVEGHTVLIVDDLIASGGTMARAARACREAGAGRVFAAAAHGLFVKDAAEVVADDAIDGVAVADTVPPFRLPEELVARKVARLDGAGLFAEAVRRLNQGDSLVELIEGDPAA